MEPKDVKALRRGLFWLVQAIIAAIVSVTSEVVYVSVIAFVVVVVFSFLAYLNLAWENPGY